MNPTQKVYCGVDVSKHYLDAFTGGRTVHFENTAKGAKALMKQAGDVHYVFESTGGYERLAAWMLLAAGRTASVVKTPDGCANTPKAWASWPRPTGSMPG